MSRPLTSICIPSYNRSGRLKLAESVLEQSADDIEIIVGDDQTSGRADVEEIGDGIVSYFANEQDVGTGTNRLRSLWNGFVGLDAT